MTAFIFFKWWLIGSLIIALIFAFVVLSLFVSKKRDDAEYGEPYEPATPKDFL
jgi:heme/copper-type cytochrome/quinol oxidase subunit 2